MDRCVILNDNNKLYNREIGLPAFLNRIKYIRGGWQVKPNRVGSVDLGTVDPSAAQRSRKYLRAITVPTLRSKTMPSLSPNFTGQEPCQRCEDLLLGTIDPRRVTKCARIREYNNNQYRNYAESLHKNPYSSL